MGWPLFILSLTRTTWLQPFHWVGGGGHGGGAAGFKGEFIRMGQNPWLQAAFITSHKGLGYTLYVLFFLMSSSLVGCSEHLQGASVYRLKEKRKIRVFLLLDPAVSLTPMRDFHLKPEVSPSVVLGKNNGQIWGKQQWLIHLWSFLTCNNQTRIFLRCLPFLWKVFSPLRLSPVSFETQPPRGRPWFFG